MRITTTIAALVAATSCSSFLPATWAGVLGAGQSEPTFGSAKTTTSSDQGEDRPLMRLKDAQGIRAAAREEAQKVCAASDRRRRQFQSRSTPRAGRRVSRPAATRRVVIRNPHPRQYRGMATAVDAGIAARDLPSASRLDAQDARERNLIASAAAATRQAVREDGKKTRGTVSRLAQEERQRALLFLLLAVSLFFLFACWTYAHGQED